MASSRQLRNQQFGLRRIVFFSTNPDWQRLAAFTSDFRLLTSGLLPLQRPAIRRESYPDAKLAVETPSNQARWTRCRLAPGPRSTIKQIFPPSCWRTCLALVGEMPAGQIRAGRGERKTALANHRLNKRMARPAYPDRCARPPRRCREFPLRAAEPASTAGAKMLLPIGRRRPANGPRSVWPFRCSRYEQ